MPLPRDHARAPARPADPLRSAPAPAEAGFHGARTALRSLLRPLAWTWVSRVQGELDSLPHPVDEPRQRAVGPNADHVLIVGNGAAIGFGVTSFRLALPGQLARSLAVRTGRGAVVEVAGRRGTTAERARSWVGDLGLHRYDGIVLTVGATDALRLLPARHWRFGLEALLDELDRTRDRASVLVVLGIPPVQRSLHSSGFLGDLVDRHALQLNEITAEVCASRGLPYVMPDMGYRAEAMSRGAAQRIQGLAGDLAVVMTPALNGVSARGLTTSPRSARGVIEAEQDRQAALDELALRRERNPRIDQLTRMAKLAFGTRYAAVTLIDGESQWYKSAINLPDRVIPRSLALCARTVQQDDALVIEDLTTDPRSPAPMLEYGVRFYAGVPIESRDGYRVGALCVLDDQPHAAEDFDLRLLQHFAIEIQRELWQEAAAVE